MTLRKILIAAATFAVVAGGAAASYADTPWRQRHPRREEVNQRLANLNRKVRDERGEGGVTGARADRLHDRLHAIRMQERRFARHDHGHVTKHEMARLNREENGVRRHIPG